MAAKLKFGQKSTIPPNGGTPFFLQFFFTLFSSSMYSQRPYLETFYDLSLFIMWKSSKMARKLRLDLKFFRYSSPLKKFQKYFFESKTLMCVNSTQNNRLMIKFLFQLAYFLSYWQSKIVFWVHFVHSRIFFVTFSPFFLNLCIYRERQLRRFSMYHFLSRGSVQKWPQS